MRISQQPTAIIWLTHFFDPAADSAFERLAREANGFGRVFRLRQYSNSVGPPAPEIPGEVLVSDMDMAQALRIRPQGIDFASGIPQGIVDLLHFAILGKLEKFAYYWFIEYDVDFSGNWQTFFSSFQNCNADLLGTTIYPRSLDLNWHHWKTFAAPPSVPAQFVTRGFFPIFRISSRFADIYRTEVENTWSGHFEALYPTIARYKKLSVEDIGGSGPFVSRERLDLFYSNNVADMRLFPGTFRFSPRISKNYYSGPSKDFPISNKLWHPIKTTAYDRTRKKIQYISAANATEAKTQGLMADASFNAIDGIPSRIFQTWKTKELPSNYAFWRNTLVEKNGRFEFELWDDQDNRKFIEESAAWFLPTYDSYPAEIYRVDVVRYFYLYLKGGFYIDLDTECLRPLSKFLQHPGVLLGRMGPNPEFDHSIPNAIMASRAKEEFWLLVIALAMERSSKQERPEAMTGPILLKNAVDLYVSDDKVRISSYVSRCSDLMSEAQQPRPQTSKIFILGPREWYPIDWSDPIHLTLRRHVIEGRLLDEPQKQKLFPTSSLVTYWTHSWEDLKKLREQFPQMRLQSPLSG